MQPKLSLKPIAYPQQGYVLLLVPLVLAGILLLGLQMTRRSQISMHIAGAEMSHLQTRLCAESVVAVEVNRASLLLESGGVIEPETLFKECPGENGASAVQCTVDLVEPTASTNTGCYDVVSHDTRVGIRTRCGGSNSQTSTLDLDVSLGEIPLYQFAAFYEKTMLVHPGPDMEIRGRVHSNEDIVFRPAEDVALFDWLTAAGKVELIKRDNCRVLFAHKNGTGPDYSAPVDPTSTSPRLLHKVVSGWQNWKDNHRVAYAGQANGCGTVQSLSLPVTQPGAGRKLIEWRQDSDTPADKRTKMAWKAALLYKEGSWLKGDLSPVTTPFNPIAVPAAPSGWTSTYASRVDVYYRPETYMMRLLPVNVATLQTRSAQDSVIYLHDDFQDPLQGHRAAGGFLLYNGATLTRPLTIVTNAPMLLLGDYNTAANYVLPAGGTGFFPAALISDGFFHLSSDFLPEEHDEDGETMGSPVMSRNPSASLVLNACITPGGALDPDDNTWNPLHSLVQHLEELWEMPYRITGSMTCLWTSQHVSERPENEVDYEPPNREVVYDPMYRDLRNMPPGTPRLVMPVLNSWELVRR